MVIFKGKSEELEQGTMGIPALGLQVERFTTGLYLPISLDKLP